MLVLLLKKQEEEEEEEEKDKVGVNAEEEEEEEGEEGVEKTCSLSPLSPALHLPLPAPPYLPPTFSPSLLLRALLLPPCSQGTPPGQRQQQQ